MNKEFTIFIILIILLAQRFGLVQGPPKHLSEGEWSNVKALSNARDDSKEPCVICKEDFGLQEQVEIFDIMEGHETHI